ELLDVSPTPGRDENVVDTNVAALAVFVFYADDFLTAFAPNRLRRPTGVNLDSFFAQNPPNARDDLGIFLMDDLVHHFHNDHLDAEAAKHLGEFNADVSAAEDQQRRGKFVLF